ncbi:DUF6265 family protein [Brevundimonas sp.]|uniref:DUF6265 family protein n=1 Tax=Brevundimonas sp. TaxID=1871086 RepID=UPI0025B86730|nr:DUF6265 family protein [Brevundimonas sp.]
MLTALILAAVLDGGARPDLGWMSGYWLACDPGREVSEVWTDPRLSLMTGMTVTVRGDRVGYEQSRIAPTGSAPDAPFAYFAQPDGQPVTVFPVTASGDRRVVFEQAADDDFPKRIVYERDGDVLSARIEGEIGGETRTVRWRFNKAELNSRCPA